MLELRPVLYAIGVMLALLAGSMLVPALVDAASNNDNWRVFLMAAGLTMFLAGGTVFATRQADPQPLSIRQTFLLTTLSWIVIAAFAALPLRFADLGLSFADAYFEAMSGLTTTGSTVIVGLDGAPPGILLWRAMLQSFGGIGIIVLSLAVMPFLQVGGMQLFRTESSDRSEKILPRAKQIAAHTGGIYVALTLACAIAYWTAGMSAFDAITHAMPTISTGGFANYDASFGQFASPAIEWIATLFMFLGGASFSLFIMTVHGRPEALWRDSQMRWYLAVCAAASLALAAWHAGKNGAPWEEALRQGAFSAVSIITTTGFVTADYATWGPFAVVLIFALTFVGGCTGSTAGGIKVFRFQILFATMRRQFFGLINPHGVRQATYNGQPVPASVPLAVTSFFFLYGLSVMTITGVLALLGLDFVTSISSAATAMGNVGPGLGDIVGPSGNFSTLPDGAKALLAFAMLLGRLELFTVLMLLTPRFWRG
jgi:trk system potassium uptake protein TrkH